MRKIGSILLFMITGYGISLQAQVDPHFAQYYVYPSFLNPALTGAFNGSYRVTAIYRNQWNGLTKPFSTKGISTDFTTKNNVNVGISILNQSAGNAGYNYTTAYTNLAYTGVRFGKDEQIRVVFGLQAGFIDRRFNKAKLSFGDQWNSQTGYSPNNPTAEVISKPSSTSYDMGAGILIFDASPSKPVNFFGGVSASHLTKPNGSIMLDGMDTLPVRLTGHAGLKIRCTDNFSITPNFLILRQGNAREIMFGAYGQYKVTETTEFLLGLNYRLRDAYSPYLGFTYKNLVVGMSYDVNDSPLGNSIRNASSLEFSVTLIGLKKFTAPGVNFVCPRL